MVASIALYRTVCLYWVSELHGAFEEDSNFALIGPWKKLITIYIYIHILDSY